MRIALISTCALATPPAAYGGTELVVAELAKGLVRTGHDVTVFATADSTTDGTLRSTFARPVWPPDVLAELRHAGMAWQQIAARGAHFDVVHVHHGSALPYSTLVPVPTLLTIHHMRDESLLDHYRAYPHVSYVAISHRQAALCPELRVDRTIHHGLDPDRYPRGDGAGGYVAFLGRFAPEKAPHVAIDAARRAGVRLCLGGAPHEPARAYFEREIRPRLGDPYIECCGELSHRPKLRLLQGARGLLFPLHWEEPFGLVMIEAMLGGTPVIAIARGSAPEVIEEGVTGFLVDDERQLAERIRQLAYIDRDRCRARARARWSHLRMAREYADLYEHLAARGAPARSLPVRLPTPRPRAQPCGPGGPPNRLRQLARVVDDIPWSRDDQDVENVDESRDPSYVEATRDRAECEAADARRIRGRV